MYSEAGKRYLLQRQRMFFLFSTGSHITKEGGNLVWLGKSLATPNGEQMSSKVENTAIAPHRD